MRKLTRFIQLEYPIPDDFIFSRNATKEFADKVRELIEFINHELEMINSNFKVTEGDE